MSLKNLEFELRLAGFSNQQVNIVLWFYGDPNNAMSLETIASKLDKEIKKDSMHVTLSRLRKKLNEVYGDEVFIRHLSGEVYWMPNFQPILDKYERRKEAK